MHTVWTLVNITNFLLLKDLADPPIDDLCYIAISIRHSYSLPS